MKVPFFDYKHLFSSDKKNFLRVFEEVGNRGAYIMQDDLSTFESEIDLKHLIISKINKK